MIRFLALFCVSLLLLSFFRGPLPPPPAPPKTCIRQSLNSVTGCSGRNLIKLVHLVFPKAKVFMDIGMNKGFFSAACLELWSPQLNISSANLTHQFKVLKLRGELQRCGYCRDCEDTNTPVVYRGNTHDIRVYSFDGNERFIDGVSLVRDTIMTKPGRWKIELAAFSDHAGKTVTFSINQDELGKITTETKPNVKTAQVQTMTIDKFMEREKLARIDLLKIDTEGHDPFVIRGARETLRKHQITVFTFEYHYLWPKDEFLERTLTKDIGDNYVCYMAAERDKMIKLTDGCWYTQYECRKFSNIWCVSKTKGKQLVTIFESMV